MFQTTTFDNPEVLPPSVRRKYRFLETSSASAVLKTVCPAEWKDIVEVLDEFVLDPKWWMRAGGNRGDIAKQVDGMFEERGWTEARLDLRTQGFIMNRREEVVKELPPLFQEGYLVDNFKGSVALDVEWNAKDGNLDRDMTAYRTWHSAGVLTGAVIFTKHQSSLKTLLNRLWSEWNETLPEELRKAKTPIDMNTSTTTNLEKAELRMLRGVMGTCPLLVVGVSEETWNGEPYNNLLDITA